MKTALTIVIPMITKDRGFLQKAVNSVLLQTTPCKLIIEREDVPCAVNLQNGVSKVDTEFFAILADDDILKPQFAALMLKAIGNNDVCIADAIQFTTEKTTVYKSTYSGFENLLLKNTIHGGAVIYRTSKVQGKYDTSLICAEEYDIHLRLADEGASFTHLAETVYLYRKHEGQKSKKIGDNIARRTQQIELIKQKYTCAAINV